MKIESFDLGMSSSSISTKSYLALEKSVVNGGGLSQLRLIENGSLAKSRDNVVIASGNGQTPKSGDGGAATLLLTPEAQEQLVKRDGISINKPEVIAPPPLVDKSMMLLWMLERLTETITGKKLTFRLPQNPLTDNAQRTAGYTPVNILYGKRISAPITLSPNAILMNGALGIQQTAAPIQRTEVVQITETYRESQNMSFSAAGIVNTTDGRQIRFDMNVNMSYEFYSSNSSTIERAMELGRLCDPLVINFDGNIPQLTKDRYGFDINIGGNKENIFMPTGGSGFLAYDKNGNNVIDDGSELFGAATGNGFAELAAYDGDGNGWIDENDSIFSDLKIMSVDKDTGEFMMITLKDAGVGAIFLGSAVGNFEINNADNETQGIVRRNGFFLFESGGAGSVQHIDLTY